MYNILYTLLFLACIIPVIYVLQDSKTRYGRYALGWAIFTGVTAFALIGSIPKIVGPLSDGATTSAHIGAVAGGLFGLIIGFRFWIGMYRSKMEESILQKQKEAEHWTAIKATDNGNKFYNDLIYGGSETINMEPQYLERIFNEWMEINHSLRKDGHVAITAESYSKQTSRTYKEVVNGVWQCYIKGRCILNQQYVYVPQEMAETSEQYRAHDGDDSHALSNSST